MSFQSPLLPTAATTTRTAATTTHRRITDSKRAVRSLAVFLLANLIWPVVIIFLFPTGKNYEARPKPVWFPSVPVVHIGTLGSALFMGLSGWLFWAEGGFTAQKGENSDALPIYVSQISTGVTWQPAILRIGSAELGWVFCLANFGFLFACYEKFKKVNPIAGALVTPALAWSVYLCSVTCYLIYL